LVVNIYFYCSWDISHTYSLHIHTPPLLQVELEKDGWVQVDMLWCQECPEHIGLSNHKLKSAQKRTVHNTRPSQADKTNIIDERTLLQ